MLICSHRGCDLTFFGMIWAGVVLPLLQQSYLLWQVLVNKLLLGKNLKRVEVTLPPSACAHALMMIMRSCPGSGSTQIMISYSSMRSRFLFCTRNKMCSRVST